MWACYAEPDSPIFGEHPFAPLPNPIALTRVPPNGLPTWRAMSPSHVENDVTLKPSIIPQRGGVSEAGDPTSAQGGRKNPRMWHVEGDVTFKPSIIFRPGFHQPKCQPQPATASRCEESTCHESVCSLFQQRLKTRVREEREQTTIASGQRCGPTYPQQT